MNQPRQKSEALNPALASSSKKKKSYRLSNIIRFLYLFPFLFMIPLGITAVILYWSAILFLSIAVLSWSWLDAQRGKAVRGIAMDVGIMSVIIGIVFWIYKIWIIH